MSSPEQLCPKGAKLGHRAVFVERLKLVNVVGLANIEPGAIGRNINATECHIVELATLGLEDGRRLFGKLIEGGGPALQRIVNLPPMILAPFGT